MATHLTGEEISVAVATCGRPASLARCLAALAAGTMLPRETIVVDQAPSAESRRVVEQCWIEGTRYLEQPRLGTSAARNLALATASGAVLAITDDDCAPGAEWLTEFWAGGRSRAWTLAQTALLHPYGHYYEARVAAGLLGSRSP